MTISAYLRFELSADILAIFACDYHKMEPQNSIATVLA